VQVMSTGIAIQLGTSWARYTATIAVPSISSKTLGTAANNYTRIEFWYSSGATNNATAGNIAVQSGTIQLWGVQLEIGSVATPLERPDPQVDLANCQRFYCTGAWRLDGTAAVTGAGASTTLTFPTTMRANPTVTPTYTTQTNCGSSSMAGLSLSNVLAYTVTTAIGGWVYSGTFAASADL